MSSNVIILNCCSVFGCANDTRYDSLITKACLKGKVNVVLILATADYRFELQITYFTTTTTYFFIIIELLLPIELLSLSIAQIVVNWI